jgi:hypothetical protein
MPLPVGLGIGAVLATIIVPLVVKVLAAFGVGFITYTGINLLLDSVLSAIQANFASIGFTAVANLLAYMNVDIAITMMISAITMRATLRGLQAGGDLKKLGFA